MRAPTKGCPREGRRALWQGGTRMARPGRRAMVDSQPGRSGRERILGAPEGAIGSPCANPGRRRDSRRFARDCPARCVFGMIRYGFPWGRATGCRGAGGLGHDLWESHPAGVRVLKPKGCRRPRAGPPSHPAGVRVLKFDPSGRQRPDHPVAHLRGAWPSHPRTPTGTARRVPASVSCGDPHLSSRGRRPEAPGAGPVEEGCRGAPPDPAPVAQQDRARPS